MDKTSTRSADEQLERARAVLQRLHEVLRFTAAGRDVAEVAESCGVTEAVVVADLRVLEVRPESLHWS
ncbi:MAG: hypothetical protein QM723_05275 [Myxococcaceae bacterium]